jgi:sortase A
VYTGSNLAYAITSQMELASQWDSDHRAQPQSAVGNGGSGFAEVFQVQRPRLAVGQPLAKISVPSARWSGVVLEGTDERVLAGGPGHVVSTAYPGEPDNMVISNHNTYSMQFADLKPGDQILLDADYGRFVYRVAATRITGPDDRSATGHIKKARLTFITCWPLWAGAFAAQRLVVVADQVAG